MFIKYLTFSISIAFISWIAGMILNAFLIKTSFYKNRLSYLNFLTNENHNKLLGLGVFKWILLHSFFKFFNPKLSMKKTIKISELQSYRDEMTLAEFNHLLAFLFMAIFILIKIFKGLYLFALVMMMVNLLMNIYPVLLQQQNKRRIDRFAAVMELKNNRLG